MTTPAQHSLKTPQGTQSFSPAEETPTPDQNQVTEPNQKTVILYSTKETPGNVHQEINESYLQELVEEQKELGFSLESILKWIENFLGISFYSEKETYEYDAHPEGGIEGKEEPSLRKEGVEDKVTREYEGEYEEGIENKVTRECEEPQEGEMNYDLKRIYLDLRDKISTKNSSQNSEDEKREVFDFCKDSVRNEIGFIRNSDEIKNSTIENRENLLEEATIEKPFGTVHYKSQRGYRYHHTEITIKSKDEHITLREAYREVNPRSLYSDRWHCATVEYRNETEGSFDQINIETILDGHRTTKPKDEFIVRTTTPHFPRSVELDISCPEEQAFYDLEDQEPTKREHILHIRNDVHPQEGADDSTKLW